MQTSVETTGLGSSVPVEKFWNAPNFITLFRIAATPLLLLNLFWQGRFWSTLVGLGFLAVSLTDLLDGYLARRTGEETRVGKLLDPIADKLLTVSAFIALVELRVAPAWMVVVIVGREFAVSGMRSIAITRGVVIAASPWGKYKMVSQVVAITLLILTNTLERWVRFGNLGKAALWIVMILAIYSMLQYFRNFVKSVGLGLER